VSVAVVGINHRTVPLQDLEPLIVPLSSVPKALADLSSRPHLDEVVILSTCMRTEVYALVNRFHGAMADIREFFATWSGKPPEEFSDNLYSYFDEAAVGHLFRVSAGLDSVSVGEGEILGQVRQAWEVARSEGSCGPALSAAFRHALQAGKRARSETDISRGTTSLSYAAVEMATGALGNLDGKQALVVGLGEVGEMAARAFSGVPGMLPVVVCNRNQARAEEVAATVGGQAAPWKDLVSALAGADVVACSTSGQAHLLAAGTVGLALAARPQRPLLLVDMAVPRDIDPAVADLPGVTLLNMDDIGRFVAVRAAGRRAEVPAVELIVAQEVDRFNGSLAARSVAPLVTALHERAEAVRQAEVERLARRANDLSPEQLQAVDAATRRVVAKVLHEPTVNLKDAAGTARGDVLADAFRDLFGLEP
jgi:glutamyl-tRNA reductase